MKKVIFVVGPTAVGKTSFAIRLAKACNGEIISSDSMAVYRQINILSQKPTKKEQKAVIHHLTDTVDINEEYSAARFVKEAVFFLNSIIAKGKVPVVAGGSGLYIKALIDGLFPAPGKDVVFREALKSEAGKFGSLSLHERLKKIDLEAALKIHPNDLRRIIRAHEIFHLTGRTKSWHKSNTKGIKDDFSIHVHGLTRPRNILYKRIDDRVESMFKQGLVNEVKTIRNLKPSMTAAASLGYKEVCGFLDNKYSLEHAKELLKKNTRQFAKKQLTWFRADRRIVWIDLESTPEKEAVLEVLHWKIRPNLRGFLAA